MSDDPHVRRRESYLTIFLALGTLLGGALFFVLIWPPFAYAFLLLGGLFLYGAVHYLFWGRELHQASAWAREEDEQELHEGS